jgi:putative two-component system response regulator
VLVVDDDTALRNTAVRILSRAGHQTRAAATAADALRELAGGGVDVVVLDVGLPDRSGLDLLSDIDAAAIDVGVVMLTADDRASTLHESLRRGAQSFLRKPFDPLTLQAQIMVALMRQRSNRQARSQRRALSSAVHEGQGQLDRLPRMLLQRLCDAWNLRHVETGAHVRRIALYTEVLALTLEDPLEDARSLADAAIAHDLGKIAIPDAILGKPGRLTAAEFDVMKVHPVIGARMLSDFGHPFMDLAATIALRHHERWNGSGYPDGLRGDECPRAARIVAIVDVYDALSQARCYKPGWSEAAITEYLRSSSGELFEPAMVRALLDSLPEFRRIAAALPDEPPSPLAAPLAHRSSAKPGHDS